MPGLGVLDVEVVDVAEVARHARGHDVALVLDRPRLAAIANPQIAVAGIGVERHEEDARALVGQPSCDLRELRIVADHDADRAAIGLYRVHRIAALDVPVLALVGRRMDLFTRVDGAVAQEDVADVLDVRRRLSSSRGCRR